MNQQNILYKPITRFEKKLKNPEKLNQTLSPFSIFPTNGILDPGASQRLWVTFTPSLPQYDVVGIFKLKSDEYSEDRILIHGIGASSSLECDVESIDFGVLRIGQIKASKITLRNRGILQVRFG